MLFVDVNVLVHAHRPEAPRHDEYRDWLESVRVGHELVAVSAHILAGFLRVVTHPRVFRDPTPTAIALDFAEGFRRSPSVISVIPGPRRWAMFERLVRSTDARGNLVSDAFIAAMAMEQGATLVTADRGFARFSGLAVRHPLD